MSLQRELKDISFELSQKNETLAMKIDTIKQLQDQLDGYRRSQNTDADRLRKEIGELQSKVIEKEEVITQLHYKFEDLIQSQVIEIPIYGGLA